MIQLGWILTSDRLPELYKLLQYASAYCKNERLSGWASGTPVEAWNEDLAKIETWLAEIKARWG